MWEIQQPRCAKVGWVGEGVMGMQGISEWLNQLGFLILFAGLSEIILPNSSVRKTTRLFIGLIVILSIIDPLVGMMANPHWLDGLYLEVFSAEGDAYVEAGTEMATRVTTQAEQIWMGQVGQQVSVFLSLIDGIFDANVALLPVAGDGPWNAEVTVWSADSVLKDEGLRAEKEWEITNLIDKMLQPRGVAQVRFAWHEAADSR